MTTEPTASLTRSSSTERDASTSVRISVVVPVYEPGESFDELIASLDAQTLPRDRFEVLLCDDGSGADTRARLERVARERSNVRVLLLPRTGWPGTPRNHGIDAARGEYVQFVDQDDRLYPAALERLCEYADEHGSDVVVGREVGVGRTLPQRIFRRDIPNARLGRDPLLSMLTPHKTFRTAFLRHHGIRFPDGRVRLEDHRFVMRAYFEADVISILASTPIYAWVKHAGSASASRIDPDEYFPHLEAVLDLVEEHTEPGRFRDRLMRHWLRGKILKRLSGRQMARYPAEYRERFFDVVTPLVERRFGPGVDAGLDVPDRVRVALLRSGRRDDLLALARLETELRGRADVTSATWSRGGGLHLRLQLSLSGAGGAGSSAEAQTPDDALRAWSDPVRFDDVRSTLLGQGRDPGDDRVELLVRHSDDAEPLRRVASASVDRDGRAFLSADPLTIFRRVDETGSATLVVRIRRAGWLLDADLVLDEAVAAAAGASPFLAGRTCSLEASASGEAVLRRTWPSGRLKDTLGRVARRVRRRMRRAAQR